jgi:hypothetical protein
MEWLSGQPKTGVEYDSPIKDMKDYENWSLGFKLWRWVLWMSLKMKVGDKLSSIHFGSMRRCKAAPSPMGIMTTTPIYAPKEYPPEKEAHRSARSLLSKGQ